MFEFESLFVEKIPVYGFYGLAIFTLLSLFFSSRCRNSKSDLEEQVEEKTENLNQALAELRETNRKLEASKEEKTQLVNVLCHDLATALAGMNLLVKKIQKQYGEKPELKRLKDLMSNVHSILGSVREARAAEAGQRVMELESVSFSAITQTLENFYGEKLREKNLSLRVSQAEHPKQFLGNPLLLANNVLGNLMSNAIKFTPQYGEIIVAQENCDETGEVRLKVCDNGHGMPASYVEKLNNGDFSPQCGTAGEKGHGLGLSIVKFYVNQLGGRLHIESSTPEEDMENHGTTVSVYLKALDAEENRPSYLQ